MIRFWSKVDDSAGPDGCWPWTACLTRPGYGSFMLNRSSQLAHRVAFELTYGPTALHVLHGCGSRACCNPRHLYAGTDKQNAADRAAHGRTQRGSRHALAKLTSLDVVGIRFLVALGHKQCDVAAGYDISSGHVSKLVGGLQWQQL